MHDRGRACMLPCLRVGRGSGIVVSYKKQGFEECLGNVMTFNSLLIIYGLNGVLEFTYLNLEIDVHMG